MELMVKGRNFLVTGGSRGLGRAVVDELRREGARVYTTSRWGGEDFVLNTAQEASRRQFLERSAHIFWDGVFINTGGPKSGDLQNLLLEDWHEAFEQLLLGPVEIVRGLLPRINDGGALLFNTSSSIQVPIPHLLLSNVFRASIYALAKSLVDELAPRRIRVNVMVPGRIDTERVAQLDDGEAQRSKRSVQDVRAASEAHIPLGRYGTPQEFGRMAAFVLSPQGSYLNGATFWVDGGQKRSL